MTAFGSQSEAVAALLAEVEGDSILWSLLGPHVTAAMALAAQIDAGDQMAPASLWREYRMVLSDIARTRHALGLPSDDGPSLRDLIEAKLSVEGG